MQPAEGERFDPTRAYARSNDELRECGPDPPARLCLTLVWEQPDPDDVDTLVALSRPWRIDGSRVSRQAGS